MPPFETPAHNEDHDRWVLALAKSLVHDEHAAADIAQETLLDLHSQPGTPNQSTRGWLRRVVRNKVADYYAARSRRLAALRDVRASQRPSATCAESTEPATDAFAQRRELRTIVLEALARLDVTDQKILRMAFFEHDSLVDVAAGLGVPYDAARMRLARAKQRLRSDLVKRYGKSQFYVLVATSGLGTRPESASRTSGPPSSRPMGSGPAVGWPRRVALVGLCVLAIGGSIALSLSSSSEPTTLDRSLDAARLSDNTNTRPGRRRSTSPRDSQPTTNKSENDLVTTSPTASGSTDASTPDLVALMGRVVRTDREPITGLRITMVYTSGENAWHDLGKVRVLPDGAFRVEDVDVAKLQGVGHFEIEADDHPKTVYQKAAEKVLGGSFEIELLPFVRAQGRLVDRDGQPERDALVSYWPGGRFRRTNTTDENGRFSLPAAKGCKLMSLFVQRRGSEFEERLHVDQYMVESRDFGDMIVPIRDQEIVGLLLDAEGRPRPKTSVRAYEIDTDGRSIRDVKTDEHGRFRISSLRLVPHELESWWSVGPRDDRFVGTRQRVNLPTESETVLRAKTAYGTIIRLIHDRTGDSVRYTRMTSGFAPVHAADAIGARLDRSRPHSVWRIHNDAGRILILTTRPGHYDAIVNLGVGFERVWLDDQDWTSELVSTRTISVRARKPR